MLNNNDYKIIVAIFVISIFLGGLIRVYYYSKNKHGFIIKIVNMIILSIMFPIMAYKDIIKHKTKYIEMINKDDSLSPEQKKKIRIWLNSNAGIRNRVFYVYFKKFKLMFDMHIEALNKFEKKHGNILIIKFETPKLKYKSIKNNYNEAVIDVLCTAIA